MYKLPRSNPSSNCPFNERTIVSFLDQPEKCWRSTREEREYVSRLNEIYVRNFPLEKVLNSSVSYLPLSMIQTFYYFIEIFFAIFLISVLDTRYFSLYLH